MKFEKGKFYKWIGPVKPSEWGIPEDMSKIWELGQPHKCTTYKYQELRFRGIVSKKYPGNSWVYGRYESNFEEVK
jgi:hypothetical protein